MTCSSYHMDQTCNSSSLLLDLVDLPLNLLKGIFGTGTPLGTGGFYLSFCDPNLSRQTIYQNYHFVHPLSLLGCPPTYLSSNGIPLQGLGVAQEQLKLTTVLKPAREVINFRSTQI